MHMPRARGADRAAARRRHAHPLLPMAPQSDVVEFYWAVWLPGYHAHVRKVRNLPREQLRSNVEVDDDSEIEESEEKEKE